MSAVAFLMVQVCAPNQPCTRPILLASFESAFGSGKDYCEGSAAWMNKVAQTEAGHIVYLCVDPAKYREIVGVRT